MKFRRLPILFKSPKHNVNLPKKGMTVCVDYICYVEYLLVASSTAF